MKPGSNAATCNFKQRQLKHIKKEHEVICAVGRVGKVARRVVVFVVYVPPSLRSQQLEELREAVATEVAAVKTSYCNPLIFVTGDFNHRDFGGALAKIDEGLTQIATDPTRGGNTIDLVYSNAGRDVVENRVLPPLQSDSGAVSDHKCLFLNTEVKEGRKFEWVVRHRRTRNQARDDAFAEELGDWDWSDLQPDHGVDAMTARLEEVVANLTEKHFPMA